MTNARSPRLREEDPLPPVKRLVIHLLGNPESFVSGEPLSLGHNKSQALFYYLAAAVKPVSRDYLASLLWGEASTSEALHSLRSSLYQLRQNFRFGGVENVLLSDGELLSLHGGFIETDLTQFRRLITAGEEAFLRQAVSLYRGPFLQGFHTADAPAYEAWQQTEKARFSRLYCDALDRLASAAEARQDGPSAIQFLQKLVSLDTSNEAFLQRLLQAHLRQGEIGPALRQYRHFEKQLKDDFGMEPSLATRELLYEALRLQRNSGVLTLPPVPRAHQVAPLPMIGRNHELDRLHGLAHNVQAGRGATILVEGEAGIGKSRLIEELAASLEKESPPWLVLQGACSPFDDLLSYGPFLVALQGASMADPLSLPIELDPSLPDTRGRFSWRVLQTLQSLTHSLPLMLIIEDLQWANSSTLNLFGFLSMRLQRMPVLLVGSVQHADSIPALRRLIALGRRRGDLEFIPLAPLTLEGVIALLRASKVEAVSIEDLAEWLYVRSTGSPFLINEILAQLRQENLLNPVGDGWELDSSRWWRWRSSFELPETTHDLVSWRLANLSPEAIQILDILAVAGQPLPAAILSNFPGVPGDRYSMILDDLAARRLIIEPLGGKIALPHHLLRKTILHRLSNLHRRLLHRQLAEALESNMPWEDSRTTLQLAMHAVAGEDIGRARRYGLSVLGDLPQDYTGSETVDFVHHLHDLLAPSASPGEMALLTRSLGRLHLSLGELEEASRWLESSLGWSRKATDRPAQAAAHFEMSELALMANDYRQAITTAQAGLAELQTALPVDNSSGLSGKGRRLLGAAFAMEGRDLAAAESHLQAAVAALRGGSTQIDLCAALFELGNISAQRGDLAFALAYYDESARTAEAGHFHYYLSLAKNNFAYHSLLLGEIEAAENAASQGLKVAEAYDLLAALLHLYSTRGEIHLYLAEWQEAQDSFERGLAIAEDLGSLERQAGYRGGLALVARGRGELDEAVRLLKEALFLIDTAGYWHLLTRLQLWLAETYFLQKDDLQANALLEKALETAHGHHRTLLLIQGETLQASLLASKGNWEAAAGLFQAALSLTKEQSLPLETARVQAAWGKAALLKGSSPVEAQALLEAARATFERLHARAELAVLLD